VPAALSNDQDPGEEIMNKPKTAARKNKTPKAEARNLKVKTSVKAGGLRINRCEILQRQV
jgi:hypothetical protein